MADFVLVSALVSVLFVAVLQVGLTLHVRNTLISCASEGARLGARDGSSPEEGAARTRALISTSLSARFARDVSAGVTVDGGVQVVAVRVRAPLPVLGPLGVDDGFDLVGHAFIEAQ
ncbi:TadE family protein [Phycicoccus sp. Soil802]|uniref:TadE family protein n=1 Tax=Phycicoccus sp. Soil802 TaxID=1736414 RepID=UPI0007026084|nr:TadE family protein [Phycicoccus sp. Soil802]KRF27114.1 pilus assembly protein TadE [Phycicoccus sp. Soil802]